MKEDIIYKLSNFLTEKISLTTESDVLYFMVEIRKILDHLRSEAENNDYSIIRFYADWSVHIQKDRISVTIKNVMKKVDESIPLNIKTNHFAILNSNKANIEFIYMKHLKEELRLLLNCNKLPTSILDGNNWNDFLARLVAILVDQPIKNPTSNIREFRFLPSALGAAIWIIDFNDQRGLCKFGNWL